MAPGDGARRQDAGGHADHEDGQGQGGQGLVRRQHVAHDGAGGVDHDGIGAGQRLGDGQAGDIAALLARESSAAGAVVALIDKMPLVESVRRAGVGGSRAALGRRACPGNVACLRPAARGGLRPKSDARPAAACYLYGMRICPPVAGAEGCTHVRREAGAVSGLLTRWLAIAKFFRASPARRPPWPSPLPFPYFPNGSRPGSSQARAALVHGSNFRNPGRCVSRRLARPGGAGGRAAPQLPLRPVGLGHRRLFQRLCPVWHPAGPRAGAMDRDAAGGRPALRRHAGLRSPSGAPDAAERWLRRMFLGNLASGMLWGHRSPTGVSSCPSSTSCSAS